jgi:hypothetical protein
MNPENLDLRGLRALAESLKSERRFVESLQLLQHLRALQPNDVECLRCLIEVMVAQDDMPGALHALSGAASQVDGDQIAASFRWLGARAMERFNDAIASGDAIRALALAEGLTGIAPNNVAVLNAAMECNDVLGRSDRTIVYAQAILSRDPAHPGAAAIVKRASDQAHSENVQRAVRLAMSPAGDKHPLIQLRDIHDAASLIHCGPMAEEGATWVERLLGAAASVAVGLPSDHELAGWEKHYRLALSALEIPLTAPEAPVQDLFGVTKLMTANGAELAWEQAAAYARERGAELVFFVAADMAYVAQYARVYVKSLRKHCDVPFMVVVHVIGGALSLTKAAEMVGDAGPELLFAGDRFDAGAIATKCYDTPPKGLIAKPVAHFQCVRFLRLAAVLRAFGLPVIVSDIDLLLQREVSDLLVRFADRDIVLNENDGNTNAGSRITANLLLVKPSKTAWSFLEGLENYLSRALSAPEVTRWIDQFGLLIARNGVLRAGGARAIGYFDTSSDINNLMYRSYQKNPFRFLSLYHGFDMASLGDEDASPTAPQARAG